MIVPTQTLNVGIDVSKAKLDVHLRYKGVSKGKTFQVANNPDGRAELCSQLKALQPTLVVMEATGGYEQPCAFELGRQGISFAVVNAKYIRRFAEAAGKLHKTDPIDAAGIAEYAEKMEPPPWKPLTEEQLELKAVGTRRRQLVDMFVMERNHLEHASESTRVLMERDIKELEAKIKEIDALLIQLVARQPELAAKMEVLDSAKGIATTTAIKILTLFPEIGELTHKQAAKMAGIAPFADESGTKQRKRKCQGGRPDLRAALYMPTLCAMRWNPTIRAFRDRLLAAGKPKQLVVIACMRKFLVILNAMVRDNQTWRDLADNSH